MHKQSGYAAAYVPNCGHVAILHKTCFAAYRELGVRPKLTVNHGGWVTRSTTKAINGFLRDNNLQGKVRVSKGVMLYEFHNDEVNELYSMPVPDNGLTVNL